MNIAKKLVDALREKSKPSAYDTPAIVKRIDGQTAWVSIEGGVDETPVQMSINAVPGDSVNVRLSGGKAWITGNNTAPPTDDKVANEAKRTAKNASKRLTEIEEEIKNGDFDGKDGQDGQSVSGIVAEFCLANASEIPEGQTFEDIQYTEWSETIPEYVAGKYYWTRLAIYYPDGTVEYAAPVFDLSSQASAEADIAAQAAQSAASTAAGIAQQALTGVGNMQNHFWHDSSGAHVAENSGSLATGASQTIASEGTVMMRNGKLVTSWTGSSPSDAALNFYDCSSAEARDADLVASYGRAGVTHYINNIVAMALTASGLSFYTPDSNHKLQAVFGTAGVELYAAGVKRMVISSSGMIIYAADGVKRIAEYNSSGLTIFGGYSTEREIAHFGFDYGKDESGSTANKVIYATMGLRLYNSIVGDCSVAEGCDVTASAFSSHAEGNSTVASGSASHAEGISTSATGYASHAEGNHTIASGRSSHAEGQGLYLTSSQGYTTASGTVSHAEGGNTKASGNYSHSQNLGTTASKDAQTTIGTYNVEDTTPSSYVHPSGSAYGHYAFVVGNGTSTSNRSNALALRWDGDLRLEGNVYTNCNADSSGGNRIRFYTTERKTISTGSLNGGTAQNPNSGSRAAGTMSVAKAGYTAIGVLGYNVTCDTSANAAVCNVASLDISDEAVDTLRYNIKNLGLSAHSFDVEVTILYQAN